MSLTVTCVSVIIVTYLHNKVLRRVSGITQNSWATIPDSEKPSFIFFELNGLAETQQTFKFSGQLAKKCHVDLHVNYNTWK